MITRVSELYDLDDAAFNRAVAELAGWTDIREDRWWKSDYDEDGDQYGGDWHTGLTGIPPGGVCREELPLLASDINAAWALWPAGVNVTHERINTGDHDVHCATYYKACVAQGSEIGDVAAQTITTLWAAWKLAQGVTE